VIDILDMALLGSWVLTAVDCCTAACVLTTVSMTTMTTILTSTTPVLHATRTQLLRTGHQSARPTRTEPAQELWHSTTQEQEASDTPLHDEY